MAKKPTPKPVKKEKVHTIGSLKKRIKNLKEEKNAALKKDKKTITALRRKIKRYRRLTRKLAKGKS